MVKSGHTKIALAARKAIFSDMFFLFCSNRIRSKYVTEIFEFPCFARKTL
jgi:hypothetical protein